MIPCATGGYYGILLLLQKAQVLIAACVREKDTGIGLIDESDVCETPHKQLRGTPRSKYRCYMYLATKTLANALWESTF